MRHCCLTLLLGALSLTAFGGEEKRAEIVDLRTEHLVNPIGVDAGKPRFSWRLASDEQGLEQKRYRLILSADSLEVASAKPRKEAVAIDWTKSGAVIAALPEAYPELKPCTRYFWRVDVADSKNRTVSSPVGRFETGKMAEGRWHGNWISDNRPKDFLPAPYFRKQFELADKPVKNARLYLAAGGLFDCTVNGRSVTDNMLEPLYTRYDRRNLYSTYDVTDLLARGRENVVGVVLGNGFYNHQSLAVWNFENAPWRNRPAFCLDLEVEYADGTTSTISTDLSWKCSTGELVRNNIYTGEHRDFTLSQPGWNEAGFDDSRWGGVGLRAAPSRNVTASQAVPIRVDSVYRPVAVRILNDTVRVYDFGQNMSGVVSVKAKGERGATIQLRHGERLNPDGSLDQSNIDVYYRGDRRLYPFQTDVVTLSGDSDSYTARFGYKGFRYVEATMPRDADLDVEALFIHSDVGRRGWIESSNPIIEKLMHASRMSYLSNLMGLPTDCPQREKNGWTGDGHLAIEAGLYNFDGITVYEKWLADHRDEQQPNGVLPDIIPTCGWGYGTDNGLDWTSTIAIIPWNLYLFYGDERPLRECYDAMRRYVDYVDSRSHGNLTDWGRGDWVPVTVGSNKELTSSIYYYVDATILARAARLLGHDEDAERYSRLAANIRKAINDKYLDRSTGVYADGTQTELSMALYWGIVPDECRAMTARELNRKVEQSDYHLNVGVLGCKALLNALSENGYGETAYRVAVQDSYPGWGWWVSNGATTLLENWDLKAERDISDNHMMFGEIGAWFYKGLGGIYPDESAPGFAHINLRPYFPAGLDSFSAEHLSPRGMIRSSWTTVDGRRIYTAVIPPSATATLTLPSGETKELASGTHTFDVAP